MNETRFDTDNPTTKVNLDLLENNRGSLKRLAAMDRRNHGPLHAATHPKCRECGLKVRSSGHDEGQDHTRRAGKKKEAA